MRVTPRELVNDDDDGFEACPRRVAIMADADPEMAKMVLAADENDADGRSQWVWLRLAGGGLVLAVFPQGDTYFATEADKNRP